MVEKPQSVVTRYDGSENVDNVADLDRRTMVSGLSFSGSITKKLRANHMFQRHCEDGTFCHENKDTPPLKVQYGDFNLKLAKRPSGDYYTAASVISPIIDLGSKLDFWDAAYIEEKKTPGDTGVKFYFRVSTALKPSE